MIAQILETSCVNVNKKMTICAIKIDLPSISSMLYVHVFRRKFWRQKISNPKHSFVIFGAKILYKKCVHKMVMKLTPSVNIIKLFLEHVLAAFALSMLLLYCCCCYQIQSSFSNFFRNFLLLSLWFICFWSWN